MDRQSSVTEPQPVGALPLRPPRRVHVRCEQAAESTIPPKPKGPCLHDRSLCARLARGPCRNVVDEVFQGVLLSEVCWPARTRERKK